MKRAVKYILTTSFVVFLLAALLLGVMVYHGMYLFTAEDQTVFYYTPVVEAIDAYTAANGSPPENLAKLVPDYVDAIQHPPFTDSLNYRLLPEPNGWELSVVNTKWFSSYTYLRRFDKELTEDQEPRMFRGIHDGWYALRNEGNDNQR